MLGSGVEMTGVTARVLAWALFCVVVASTTDANSEPSITDERFVAVGAPNIRLSTSYRFVHLSEGRAISRDQSVVRTATVAEVDSHDLGADLIAAIPVTGIFGLRFAARGGYEFGRNRIDNAGIDDDFENGLYGGAAELFIRNPSVGMLALGGEYDRIEPINGSTIDQFGGRVGLAAYFPDFGLGPVDWILIAEYRKSDDSNSTRGTIQVDGHGFGVSGVAGWYMTPRSVFEAGGTWFRSEGGDVDTEDRLGVARIRLLFAAPVVSTEFSLGASIGESEFELDSFAPDDRFAYAISFGIQFRHVPGKNLIEIRRNFD